MKKNHGFSIALVIFLLVACSHKIITNAPSSYTIETKKPFEETWSKVIDIVAGMGISIKNIEKVSGIIITDQYSLINSYTYQDKFGNPKNPNAYVVLERIRGDFGIVMNPDYVTCNFNIRVKPSEGGTSITINLVNLKGGVTKGKNMYGRGGHLEEYSVKSTKVFEKELAEKLQ